MQEELKQKNQVYCEEKAAHLTKTKKQKARHTLTLYVLLPLGLKLVHLLLESGAFARELGFLFRPLSCRCLPCFFKFCALLR